jgi:VCBS repeat-containing protein
MEDTMTKSLDFFLAVASGAVPGVEQVSILGINPDVDTATDPEDVWDGEGLYNYTAAGGATHYISSSNAGDTMDVTVTFLSDDGAGVWTEEELVVTVPGDTKTAIVTASGDDPVRILSVVNSSGVALLGDLYIYENSAVVGGVPSDATKIRAKVLIGNERTYMSMYTIPSGKTGYLYKRSVGIGNVTGTTLEARFQKRLVGASFQLDGRIVLDNSVISRYNEDFPLPEPLPAKTDIRATAQTVGADNTAVVASFELLLLG